MTEDEINRSFATFKRLADNKKTLFDEDIEAIIVEEFSYQFAVKEVIWGDPF